MSAQLQLQIATSHDQRIKQLQVFFQAEQRCFCHSAESLSIIAERHLKRIATMAPTQEVAAASPSATRRLRFQAEQPFRHNRISRQRAQPLSKKSIQYITTLSEGCVSSIKEETDTETETETEAETRWERSTRGDAKTFWVEQLYRYEEL